MSQQVYFGSGQESPVSLSSTIFRETLYRQSERGKAEYGRYLNCWNGRDSAKDLLEDMTDTYVYALQILQEREDLLDYLAAALFSDEELTEMIERLPIELLAELVKRAPSNLG